MDLLAALDPPREDVERPVGSLRGIDLEGFGAGGEVWCGPSLGWRALGDARPGVVIRHRGRVGYGIFFDCGPAPRRDRADDAAE